MTTETGHRQLDHTADLALELWAPTEEALLVEGARALVEILTDGAPLTPTTSRTVELDAVDPEDRLVRWLNEVLLLGIIEGLLVAEARVTLVDEGLRAEVRGAPGVVKNELKSVTYHDLVFEVTPDGARARVIIDV